jgi:hypothetical protein
MMSLLPWSEVALLRQMLELFGGDWWLNPLV